VHLEDPVELRPVAEASEASGLQGTAQNLGMAMGTAVIGTVILSVALFSIDDQIQESAVIPESDKQAIEEALDSGFTAADRAAFEEQLTAAPPEVQAEVATIFDDSALNGFQAAILVGGICRRRLGRHSVVGSLNA